MRLRLIPFFLGRQSLVLKSIHHEGHEVRDFNFPKPS